ncbi:MAG: 3'(2'),5'-bisphosphate nucleotidase CysQ [Rickettsiales bacterium]|nr:3'(2'),5'-bisphosphate nucleotidase CysQ [Rickettsiales bacterium]
MVIEVFRSVDKIYELLEKASDLILEQFHYPNLQIHLKSDNSPVTEADMASNKVITAGLVSLFPGIPIISEENSSESNNQVVENKVFWLLDPLDGTKEFVRGSDAFSINLALIKDNVPVLGFLYFPVQGLCYYGFDNQVFKKSIDKTLLIKRSNDDKIRAFIMSKRADLEKVQKIRSILAPQAALKMLPSAQKFGALIEGDADIFLCCNDVYEWDAAAGHAIINAMGGALMSFDGNSLNYGEVKKGFVSNHFLAMRSKDMLNKRKKQSIVDLCF